MTMNAILSNITTKLAAALTAAGLPVGTALEVCGYRGHPFDTTQPTPKTWVFLSVLSNDPTDLNATGHQAGSLEIGVALWVPHTQQDQAAYLASETLINDIEEAVKNAMALWESAGLYLAVEYGKPSRRPASPLQFAQYRLGEIYLKVFL